jgi:acyl-coenzyme A thioesterase PaaI-like protein
VDASSHASSVRRFSSVTALERQGSASFGAEVDAEWTIGGKPNGGYLLAMLGRAAAAVGPHPDVIAAAAQYLQAPDPGPVTIDAELLRAGRRASQLRARMQQDGRPCVEALITTSELDPEAKPFWQGGLPDPGAVTFEDCRRLVPGLPNGIRVAIMEQVEVRLNSASQGFTSGQPSGRGELRGWLALPGGEAFDPLSLLFALDAFPPATFDIEYSGWVPTMQLTANIRAVPADGPVRVLQRAQLIDGHRVDEVCFVWDSTGRLVAQGGQLAGVRLG